MVSSTTAAGTINHTARGFCSLLAKSCSEELPTAFSFANSSTLFGNTSKTTQLCPAFIRRRTMLAPILPRPTIPSCIDNPSLNRYIVSRSRTRDEEASMKRRVFFLQQTTRRVRSDFRFSSVCRVFSVVRKTVLPFPPSKIEDFRSSSEQRNRDFRRIRE